MKDVAKDIRNLSIRSRGVSFGTQLQFDFACDWTGEDYVFQSAPAESPLELDFKLLKHGLGWAVSGLSIRSRGVSFGTMVGATAPSFSSYRAFQSAPAESPLEPCVLFLLKSCRCTKLAFNPLPRSLLWNKKSREILSASLRKSVSFNPLPRSLLWNEPCSYLNGTLQVEVMDSPTFNPLPRSLLWNEWKACIRTGQSLSERLSIRSRGVSFGTLHRPEINIAEICRIGKPKFGLGALR